jgi:hypothetical protein
MPTKPEKYDPPITSRILEGVVVTLFPIITTSELSAG